jgi:NTE family protein
MSKLRIALALGSGGLRGIAHIGVLRALAEAEIQPTVYAGSSAGALVAAVAADDVSLSEMERIAARLHHKSLFQIDVLGLLRYGTGALSIYRSAPLRELCVELFGNRTFYDLRTPLLMSTVDVQSSAALWWGTAAPDVPVADAVCASCAMPGLLPPGLVSGRLCMDGSVLDPLALGAVAPLADLVIAIVLDGSAPAGRATTTMAAAPMLWWHARAMVLRDLGCHTLVRWEEPPLIVIRPEVYDAHPIRGGDPARLIAAGYEAARSVLQRWDGPGVSVDGVYPACDRREEPVLQPADLVNSSSRSCGKVTDVRPASYGCL